MGKKIEGGDFFEKLYQNDLEHPSHTGLNGQPDHHKQTELPKTSVPHKHIENRSDKTDSTSKSVGLSKDYPVTEDTHRESNENGPHSNSQKIKIHETKQLETKTTNPYFYKIPERENVPKKEQKVVEEQSEPKIGVFGFKNEKYVWPSG